MTATNNIYISDATNDAAETCTSSALNGATASSDGGGETGHPSFHSNATHGSQVDSSFKGDCD